MDVYRSTFFFPEKNACVSPARKREPSGTLAAQLLNVLEAGRYAYAVLLSSTTSVSLSVAGPISSELGNLAAMRRLHLGRNELSGESLGTIVK